MKSFITVFVFVFSFVFVFVMMSFAAFTVTPYKWLEILYNQAWQVIYCLFIGWWIATLIAYEIYKEFE